MVLSWFFCWLYLLWDHNVGYSTCTLVIIFTWLCDSCALLQLCVCVCVILIRKSALEQIQAEINYDWFRLQSISNSDCKLALKSNHCLDYSSNFKLQLESLINDNFFQFIFWSNVWIMILSDYFENLVSFRGVIH